MHYNKKNLLFNSCVMSINHSIKVSKFFYLYITLPVRYEIRFMTTPSLAF